MECCVYRSDKMKFAYLYVKTEADLESVPEELLTSFGDPKWVLNVALSAERKLALAKAEDVMQALNEVGFYLQMPPAADHAIRSL